MQVYRKTVCESVHASLSKLSILPIYRYLVKRLFFWKSSLLHDVPHFKDQHQNEKESWYRFTIKKKNKFEKIAEFCIQIMMHTSASHEKFRMSIEIFIDSLSCKRVYFCRDDRTTWLRRDRTKRRRKYGRVQRVKSCFSLTSLTLRKGIHRQV